MKKEIIWNISLLVFGLFLLMAFTANLGGVNITPGWHTNSPFLLDGIVTKMKLGLILGVGLIFFRYLLIAILSIPNEDFKQLVLLIAYCLPILVLLIGLHLLIANSIADVNDQVFPLAPIQQEIGALRKAGLFKSYSDKSDQFITELVLGRAIYRQAGWAGSGEYWDQESRTVNRLELLRLDSEKVWKGEDVEFVMEGNRAYEKLINELAEISEGHFEPIAIKEIWKADKTIELTFSTSEQDHKVYPKVLQNWADLDGIINYLNKEILNEKDFQFYFVKSETVLIIGLTKGEKEQFGKVIEFE